MVFAVSVFKARGFEFRKSDKQSYQGVPHYPATDCHGQIGSRLKLYPVRLGADPNIGVKSLADDDDYYYFS